MFHISVFEEDEEGTIENTFDSFPEAKTYIDDLIKSSGFTIAEDWHYDKSVSKWHVSVYTDDLDVGAIDYYISRKEQVQ